MKREIIENMEFFVEALEYFGGLLRKLAGTIMEWIVLAIPIVTFPVWIIPFCIYRDRILRWIARSENESKEDT